MRKFHFNKSTGRVSECHAQKSCPFGDLQQDHYESMKEGLQAYEKMMESSEIQPPVKNKDMKLLDSPDLVLEIRERLSERGLDSRKMEKAIDFAATLHSKQKRRNRQAHASTPYIEHPLRASLRLMKYGVKDLEVLQAAVLHDTVEDCSKIYCKIYEGRNVKSELEAREALTDRIRKDYGDRTAEIVLSVTNQYRPRSVSEGMTREEIHREYKEHLEENITNNPSAMLVKISDFIDNAGSLHHTDGPGFEQKTKFSAQKYLPCAQIFKNELKKPNPYLPTGSAQRLFGQMSKIEKRLESLIEKHKDA